MYKTKHPFSAIALDHALEQEYALVKENGRAVGLTENPAALRKLDGFWSRKSKNGGRGRYERTPSMQASFKKNVLAVVSEFQQQGDPFEEEREELITLHTKDVMDSEVAEMVWNRPSWKVSIRHLCSRRANRQIQES